MTRKMYIDVTLKLIVEVDEGLSVDNVMDNISINVDSETENVDVLDSQIDLFTLTDSK